MPTYKLHYFNARGRAEPARLMFAYSGTPYEDIRMEHADFGAKKSNYPFGQIPALEVDGKMLAQSHAIMRYLARTFHLTGKDDWEAALCDMYVDGASDCMQNIVPWFREQDPEKKKAIWTKLEDDHFKPFLTKYDAFLTKNGTGFFVGNQLTWTDLVLSEIFGSWQENHAHLLQGHPKIVEFINKVRSIPKIKAWIEKRPKTQN